MNATHGPHEKRQAILIADLGYGDAGKGATVDYLARLTAAHLVVRYNGGAQAAHNVVAPDGRHHTFAQFGSATFLPGVRTHLSRFMVLHPLAMVHEAEHLRALGITDALARTTIDGDALVISPYQQAANRVRELARGSGRHGSCGLGVGETVGDALLHPDLVLRARDLPDRALTARKLAALRDLKAAQVAPLQMCQEQHAVSAASRARAVFDDLTLVRDHVDLYRTLARAVTLVDGDYLPRVLRAPGTVLFEGAQGVLLDEWHGFHPYTTWSTTTFRWAQQLLDEAGYGAPIVRLGVLRAYATRHGAGPFVTEDPELAARLSEPHNGINAWQERFRCGHLDLVAARYALEVAGGVDALVVTHLDTLRTFDRARAAVAYRPALDLDPALVAGVADVCGGAITRLRPCWERNLAYQEQLTALAARSAPMYVDVGRGTDDEAFLSVLEGALHAPIALTSYGPGPDDRRRHASLGHLLC